MRFRVHVAWYSKWRWVVLCPFLGLNKGVFPRSHVGRKGIRFKFLNVRVGTIQSFQLLVLLSLQFWTLLWMAMAATQTRFSLFGLDKLDLSYLFKLIGIFVLKFLLACRFILWVLREKGIGEGAFRVLCFQNLRNWKRDLFVFFFSFFDFTVANKRGYGRWSRLSSVLFFFLLLLPLSRTMEKMSCWEIVFGQE